MPNAVALAKVVFATAENFGPMKDKFGCFYVIGFMCVCSAVLTIALGESAKDADSAADCAGDVSLVNFVL